MQSISASGSITDTRKKTDDIVHRQQREDEVLEILEHSCARSTSDEVSTKMAFTAEALAPRELVKICHVAFEATAVLSRCLCPIS